MAEQVKLWLEGELTLDQADIDDADGDKIQAAQNLLGVVGFQVESAEAA